MSDVTAAAKPAISARRLAAECIGTFFLLATVVGSGIMAEQLSVVGAVGDEASPLITGLALLGNTIPTGAILYVLITLLGPVSGAHFNPAVTVVFRLRGDIGTSESIGFIAAQIVGGVLGVWAAHLMFDLSVVQTSVNERTGPDQWFAEAVATFGLLMVILGGLRTRPDQIPMLVGLYITAAYWFTASTSFANPAVTIARSFTDTFSGILPEHAPAFIAAQLIGAVIAFGFAQWLWGREGER